MMPAGAVNAWICEACGEWTVARHRDAGTTDDVVAIHVDEEEGNLIGVLEREGDQYEEIAWTLPDSDPQMFLWAMHGVAAYYGLDFRDNTGL